MSKAKAGEEISLEARKRLGELTRMKPEFVQAKVMPKTPGGQGQWVCVTCGEPFRNNSEADSHEQEHKTHKLAWRSFETGNIEEP